jgi:ligand-binding sensor protein
MLINFNIEKLDKLLYDFYLITGLTISVWDAQFRQLSYQPKKMRTFCRIIKSSPEGNRRCFLSDKELCLECEKTGKPATHHCHAGLIDTAIPIKFKDTIMGYIMFGQVANRDKMKLKPILEKLSRELDLEYDVLFESHNELEVYDEAKISSAANILKTATRSLWLSEYIEIGYNASASKIDSYIRTHLNDELSVKRLCDEFGISKNKLYETSHQSFGMSIGEYIASARIDEAKQLLSTTDYPITQISTMVGITNYNYFTKFFKTNVGISPLKYRKSVQFLEK